MNKKQVIEAIQRASNERADWLHKCTRDKVESINYLQGMIDAFEIAEAIVRNLDEGHKHPKL